jgi:hypothetical protein
MNKDFSEIIEQRSDKELAEIITIKREEYSMEAFNAAQIEFEKRNLTINNYITIEQIEATKKNKESLPRNEIKFNWVNKFVTFFSLGIIYYAWDLICKYLLGMPYIAFLGVPITILLQVILFDEFKKKGYDKLALDFKNWSLNGWIFYVGLVVLAYILGVAMRYFY